MATVQDIASFATGVIPQSIIAANAQPTQAIVIANNQQPSTGIPCTIGATVAQNIDLGTIGNCWNNEVRYNFINNASFAVEVTIAANWHPGTQSLFPGLGFAPNAFDTAAFLTDGFPAAANLQAMEYVGTGGYTVNGFSFQVPLVGAQGALPQNQLFANSDITTFALPFDPHDNAVETTDYSPYCDCCSFNNNNGVSTKCYDLYVPCTWRSGFAFVVPAGAFGSFTINLDMIGIANTAMNPASIGMPASA